MKRPRRKHQEEHENHERWMVSYADFITLLFAFFVVMYSISSVNEGKYRVLTNSLGEAFSNDAKNVPDHSGDSLIPIDTPGTTEITPIKLDTPVKDKASNALSDEIVKEREQLSKMSGQFEDLMQGFIEQNLVKVSKHDFWIELEMNSELLFASGEADISKQALPILEKVSQLVKQVPNTISVEGYTDNQPIKTLKFPSNWDLSSARAASVVKTLQTMGVNPEKLSAVGYGEFHPIADNSTEEGRFKNRRVVLLLQSRVISRYGSDDKEKARMLNLDTSSQADSSVTSILKAANHSSTVDETKTGRATLPGAIVESVR